ncbi:23S rRNA (uracil(1939)-C(5))-methyltransferase RlmD [Flavobacteriaceae bacterium]|nr:23S rRNA (uracil(1939)-C(5))-methyltransferase RlmD [Flavobacteriaceae bacterium]
MAKKFISERYDNLEVVDITARGKGVVKSEEGKVIFVSGVVPGDKISVETYKKRRGYFEANLIKILEPSPNRIEPQCEHFGVCGGCKWQNMNYDTQLQFKQKEVLHNIKNLSGMGLPEIDNIQAAPQPYFYRNKMEYAFSNQRWLTADEIADKSLTIERKGLGFHKAGMWDKVVDIRQCHLQAEPANEIRNGVKAFALEHQLDFFNPRDQEGFLRSLMIRNTKRGAFMVLIQFFRENKVQRENLFDYLKKKFDIASLLYCINSKANDSLYDQEIICYDGEKYIVEEMEGLQFKINAKSFFQTNSEQAYELYKIARDFAGLKGEELVYDLYTGTGTIAQFIAKDCKKVVGVESVPEAIEAAQTNAEENGIKNAFFEVGDMRDVFNQDFINRHGKAEVVITDPPRNGMHPAVLKQLLLLAPKRIVYVSCNHATQARDLFLMKDQYKLIRSRAVDMFPQTQHVENVVLLEKI